MPLCCNLYVLVDTDAESDLRIAVVAHLDLLRQPGNDHAPALRIGLVEGRRAVSSFSISSDIMAFTMQMSTVYFP